MSHKKGLSNPFNYVGSKHRYLCDLFKVLPRKDDLTVCDPFFGGGDLSMHLNETWAIDGSDTCEQLIEMHEAIKSGALTTSAVNKAVTENNLDKNNQDSFYKFRKRYNQNQNPVDLYALICFSNTNRMRFSARKNEFNVAHGTKYREFNPSMQAKLNDYADRLSKRDTELHVKSVFDCDFKHYDVILIDPPYLNTTATYNEKDGWCSAREAQLHEKIKLECAKNKFVYFGQTLSNGITNELLVDFAKNYNAIELKNTTQHCSSNKKQGKKTIEVMIFN